MGIRVLLLTQWFDPEPTFKGLAFARELVRQGFEVDVLTGFPNYPTGRLYPGYRIRVWQRELIDGVRITRVPLYPSHSDSVAGRVLNYASFAFSALIFGAFMARNADVVYAYHPPLSVGVAAVLLRTIARKPVVYDVQDMWPDTLRATGMLRNEQVLGIIARICGWVYRRLDHLVVLSPGFKRLLVERQVPEQKVDVIYNWADEVALAAPRGTLSSAFPRSDRFRIVFAGNMGKAQALDAVLEAALILQRSGSRVCFVLLGGGVEVRRLQDKATREGLGNVVFLPAVSMSEVGLILSAADVLLVHLRRDPLFRITIPSKTQAYMAAGKPLLLAVEGDAAELVQRSGAGVLVEPESAEALATAAQSLERLTQAELNAMGLRAQQYYREHLSIAQGTARFAAIFRRLATAAGAS
jgi:glycosyltransferase involved in cell wall biosynthesis